MSAHITLTSLLITLKLGHVLGSGLRYLLHTPHSTLKQSSEAGVMSSAVPFCTIENSRLETGWLAKSTQKGKLGSELRIFWDCKTASLATLPLSTGQVVESSWGSPDTYLPSQIRHGGSCWRQCCLSDPRPTLLSTVQFLRSGVGRGTRAMKTEGRGQLCPHFKIEPRSWSFMLAC